MKIGFLVNGLDEEYQVSILKGINQKANELNIDVFCIQQENSSTLENSLLPYIHKKEYLGLDGIILLNSVMTDSYNFSSSKNVEELWGDLPVISVGQKIDGLPSILVQTDYSMELLIEHLINEHKYKKFVFLAGPKNHHDAIQRKEIFLKAMEAYKPWFSDLEYVVKEGSFSERSAFLNMTELFEEKPDFNPDVIVCSTDNMAIGVYKFFTMNRGNKNIKECAVTGFDDIPRSRFEIPSITTVRQPLLEMGQLALEEIVKLINKKEVQPLSYIESQVIFRESCGCHKNQDNPEYKKQLLSELQAEYIFSEQMLRFITRFESGLNFANSRDMLRFVLQNEIANLDVKNFALLIMSEENGVWAFRPFHIKKNGINIDPFAGFGNIPLEEFIKKFTQGLEGNVSLTMKYLITNNKVFGIVFYDGDTKINSFISPMIASLAQAFDRILSYEEKQRYSDYLEEEVEKRTHELIEANNKRMEVEAEVLHISEIERQRFSNDLHDDICQRLAGISMLCRSYSNQTKPIEKKQMVELAELISDTLTTTRQYAHNSFPVELESLGLNYSLSNLCNSFEKQTSIKCNYTWELSQDFDFDGTQKLNLFRIIQEGLHNIMKHAKAHNVCVSIKELDNLIYVKICDDGCGIGQVNIYKKQGIGINSMKYRANQIGAEFKISNNPTKGTCVEVILNKESNNEQK
ncbi:MAG: substrate-binding domain-containing protein [Treponema sp.]|nr:substrate-binding domain-containing protein [Treponema sp.]